MHRKFAGYASLIASTFGGTWASSWAKQPKLPRPSKNRTRKYLAAGARDPLYICEYICTSGVGLNERAFEGRMGPGVGADEFEWERTPELVFGFKIMVDSDEIHHEIRNINPEAGHFR